MPRPTLPSTLISGLSALTRRDAARPADAFSLGMETIDRRLGQGLVRAAVHEIYAASTLHAVAAEGFALALALRASRPPLIWVCEDRGRHEIGLLYGAGLHEWGLDTADLLLVRVPDAKALLAAGEDALRSGAAGVVLMSGWGETRPFTLTASRRLALAAVQGGTTAVLVRVGAEPRPSAAETRWSVATAPSRALEARAPGRPAFRTTLLRSRAGLERGEWIMEWDRETRSFVEPETSGGLVSLPLHRPAGVRAA